MTTRWLVNSRGKLHDYKWVPARSDEPDTDWVAAAVRQQCCGRDIADIIDTTEPSLVLYPHPTGRWTLQVTGIIKERGFTDSHGRQIHVSLIGVAADADGLATLTDVARLALTDKLSDVLPIDYHGLNGDALG
jgi:hypothetical protein